MKLFLPILIALSVVAGFAFVVLLQPQPSLPPTSHVSTSSQPAGVVQSELPTTTPPVAASSTPATTTPAESKKPASKPKKEPPPEPPPEVLVERVEAPYATPPESFEAIDPAARAALVNILCMPQSGSLRPISGSGVIIDPRGVVLTNAHVAQYVLLSQSPQVNLVCTIRSGSPAYPRWKAAVLYIPDIWINAHVSDINAGRVSGTGEHDYALLLITGDVQGNSLAAPLPHLPLETRESVAFQGDPILVAGYPAEFVGGIVTQQGLYAVTSVSTIKQLLTFEISSVDVFSLGGIIGAQGGSSGGPVVNAWRRVVGLITTTSEGATTAERDLHALTLNYINRDISAYSGKNLETILSGNVAQQMIEFSQTTGQKLVQKYIDWLTR